MNTDQREQRDKPSNYERWGKAYVKHRIENRLCVRCGVKIRDDGKRHCFNCRVKIARWLRNWRAEKGITKTPNDPSTYI